MGEEHVAGGRVVYKRGAHRKRREPAPGRGCYCTRTALSTILGFAVTMDDLSNYSMFFCARKARRAVLQALNRDRGERLCCSLYTDRGSQCWHTPEAGGKVDKVNLTQLYRRIRRRPGGCSERAFGTHQGRLPKELAVAGIK